MATRFQGASGTAYGGPRRAVTGQAAPAPQPSIMDAVTSRLRGAYEQTLANNPLMRWQSSGQVPAGLIQSTVANQSLPTDTPRPFYQRPLPNLIGSAITGDPNYRPALFDTPGALYGIITAL